MSNDNMTAQQFLICRGKKKIRKISLVILFLCLLRWLFAKLEKNYISFSRILLITAWKFLWEVSLIIASLESRLQKLDHKYFLLKRLLIKIARALLFFNWYCMTINNVPNYYLDTCIKILEFFLFTVTVFTHNGINFCAQQFVHTRPYIHIWVCDK